HAIQVYVSQVRKALGGNAATEGPLKRRSPGYLLAVPPDAVDAGRFEHLREEGQQALRAGDAAGARELLDRALAEWRGPAFADFAYTSWAAAERERLEEARIATLEARAEADLALGHHAAVAGELAALMREHPLREHLHALLMLALYRDGRQADALAAYRRL